MKLMGFNFTKMNIEKNLDVFENLQIKANIDISEVSKVDTDFFKKKEEVIVIKFKYSVDYEPDVAKIELLGTMIVSVDLKSSKEILKQWKDKKLPDDFRIPVFNVILRKSSVKALQLEDEMNLPLHIKLPSLRKNPSTQDNKKSDKDTKKSYID